MAEDLALETELVTVVGDRALEIGNEQHGRDPGQCRHTLMLGRRRGLGNKPLPLDRRSRQAYPVASAWLTLESCLFVEARRLEGPLARGRHSGCAQVRSGSAAVRVHRPSVAMQSNSFRCQGRTR